MRFPFSGEASLAIMRRVMVLNTKSLSLCFLLVACQPARQQYIYLFDASEQEVLSSKDLTTPEFIERLNKNGRSFAFMEILNFSENSDPSELTFDSDQLSQILQAHKKEPVFYNLQISEFVRGENSSSRNFALLCTFLSLPNMRLLSSDVNPKTSSQLILSTQSFWRYVHDELADPDLTDDFRTMQKRLEGQMWKGYPHWYEYPIALTLDSFLRSREHSIFRAHQRKISGIHEEDDFWILLDL